MVSACFCISGMSQNLRLGSKHFSRRKMSQLHTNADLNDISVWLKECQGINLIWEIAWPRFVHLSKVPTNLVLAAKNQKATCKFFNPGQRKKNRPHNYVCDSILLKIELKLTVKQFKPTPHKSKNPNITCKDPLCHAASSKNVKITVLIV